MSGFPPTPSTQPHRPSAPERPHRRRLGAGLLAAGCALGLTTSLAITVPADAAPAGPGTTPTSKITKAGRPAVRAFGSGSMGWRNAERVAGAGIAAQQRMADNARFAAKQQKVTGVLGIDVASWQGNVRWSSYRAAGKQFAYVKATEGTRYRNPYFSSQFNGAGAAGLMRGAYHFATPNRSSGKAQADYFVGRGGAWLRDGRTLPGVLDIEYNPYGSTCYGLSKTSMVSWIKSFTVQYKKRTGRDAVIYTTADWWSRCTGNSRAFIATNPLWVARYGSSVGTLPGSWPFYTFWQYSSSPIDQDVFSASASRLRVLARG